MRILVMGAGAVGSAFGGFLRREGHDVVLVGRGAHLKTIAESGLHIHGLWGQHHVSGFECHESADTVSGSFDAVLVCVKSFDTSTATQGVLRHLSNDTLLVSLQNGVGNVETMQRVSGHPWVLGGRVIFGIVRPDPGVIDITVYTQPVLIGFHQTTWRQHAEERDAKETSAQAIANAINAAGIPCEFSTHIEHHQWAKLLYSCALNPLSAIHRVHYGALPENEAWRGTIDRVIEEIFSVAAALDMPLLWSTSEQYRELFYGKLVPDTYNHRSSMLQDVESGHRTEIDALCGEVVRMGAACGVSVPENQGLLENIRALEGGPARG